MTRRECCSRRTRRGERHRFIGGFGGTLIGLRCPVGHPFSSSWAPTATTRYSREFAPAPWRQLVFGSWPKKSFQNRYRRGINYSYTHLPSLLRGQFFYFVLCSLYITLALFAISMFFLWLFLQATLFPVRLEVSPLVQTTSSRALCRAKPNCSTPLLITINPSTKQVLKSLGHQLSFYETFRYL